MPRYAAIDIGSNSVRMLAAEAAPGGPAKPLLADREVTRLGESVFQSGRISDPAMDFVCLVLKRMAASYAPLELAGVRAVATSAVRDASNQAEFIDRASSAIGAPVEIISGPEEARLIHLGVQNLWPHPKQRVLVIDVGGGSAEVIVSNGGELTDGISRPLGAVRLTEVFLRSDPPSESQVHRMEQFIDEKLGAAVKRIEPGKFDRVIGTSATAAALVSAANRVRRADRDAADRLRITTAQLRKLYAELRSCTLSKRRKLVGIGPRRAEIIVAGAATFLRVLETLKSPSMYYSVAGVRDGIIADLALRGVGLELSRLSRQQVRVAEAMNRRYAVPLQYARKIASLANQLFDGLQPVHQLPLDTGKLIQAAAYLHNVGHYISDTGHHKHSAYIVENSDMPGFTDRERMLIAQLCRYHRKSMPQLRHTSFQSLASPDKQLVLRLIPLLRMAIGLDSSQHQKVEDLSCARTPAGIQVSVKGDGDLALELWAAERAAENFQQVYGVPMSVTRGRRQAGG